ncbi:heavy-metal-associated domain-containing protein [Microvirga massiliensis]|uniref:heavy-metal-associated domain-containing protein n=1 Tax=Microvirga massiliensis TaxID=1033741 RepID=UPI00062BD6DA|nr:heavy-metal-associated domain-containing protein [Microvirga massiliensis]
MLRFRVPDMKCGGCAKGVTRAITGLDPTSDVEIDLDTKEVTIVSSLEEDAVASALERAGYAVERRPAPVG